MHAWPLLISLLQTGSLAGLQPAIDPVDAIAIYRCTDADGQRSLRDTPCPDGQQEQVQSMRRPTDPASTASAEAVAPVPMPQPSPGPSLAAAIPVTPMYECTRADGERYASDSDEGNPRWVPAWTLGYPAAYGGTRHTGQPIEHTSIPIGASRPRPPLQLPAPPAAPDTRPHRPRTYVGAGTWIRDHCVRLPQAEACNRLHDRRNEIRRSFFNAQASERDRLRLEERGINARLHNDCPA